MRAFAQGAFRHDLWWQVFLAMPSACPVAPDGSKRSVPTGADDRGAVTMYTSDDNAASFKQVMDIASVMCSSSPQIGSCFVKAINQLASHAGFKQLRSMPLRPP